MNWDVIVSFFDRILGHVDWLANAFVVIITIYGFWRAFFTKRITIISISNHYGNDGINNSIMLKNYALREVYIYLRHI